MVSFVMLFYIRPTAEKAVGRKHPIGWLFHHPMGNKH